VSDWLAPLRNFLPPELLPAPGSYEGPYKVFTTAHDLEIRGSDVESVIGALPKWDYYPSPDFKTYWTENRSACAEQETEFIALHAGGNVEGFAISILVDHSGSLRGERSCLVALVSGVLSSCLTRLAARHEILGFTTSSWYGGESKLAWRQAGCPRFPGRLCDVLHVVHRDFSERTPLSPDELGVMTRSGLLKENVDGEALEWAVRRLRSSQARRKLLFVLSDGAPVDDATLEANGPSILDDHLVLVTDKIIRDGEIELYGVGIEYDMSRYYPQFVSIATVGEIASVLLPVLRALLCSPSHSPSVHQRLERSN
jgi:cobaltochelatase CobT